MECKTISDKSALRANKIAEMQSRNITEIAEIVITAGDVDVVDFKMKWEKTIDTRGGTRDKNRASE